MSEKFRTPFERKHPHCVCGEDDKQAPSAMQTAKHNLTGMGTIEFSQRNLHHEGHPTGVGKTVATICVGYRARNTPTGVGKTRLCPESHRHRETPARAHGADSGVASTSASSMGRSGVGSLFCESVGLATPAGADSGLLPLVLPRTHTMPAGGGFVLA